MEFITEMRVKNVAQQGSELHLGIDFGADDLRGGKIVIRGLSAEEAKHMMESRRITFSKPKPKKQEVKTFSAPE